MTSLLENTFRNLGCKSEDDAAISVFGMLSSVMLGYAHVRTSICGICVFVHSVCVVCYLGSGRPIPLKEQEGAAAR